MSTIDLKQITEELVLRVLDGELDPETARTVLAYAWEHYPGLMLTEEMLRRVKPSPLPDRVLDLTLARIFPPKIYPVLTGRVGNSYRFMFSISTGCLGFWVVTRPKVPARNGERGILLGASDSERPIYAEEPKTHAEAIGAQIGDYKTTIYPGIADQWLVEVTDSDARLVDGVEVSLYNRKINRLLEWDSTKAGQATLHHRKSVEAYRIEFNKDEESIGEIKIDVSQDDQS